MGVNHGSQWERPAACLDPAVIVCFRRTAGFFPQEADHVCRLSVNRGRVKTHFFCCLHAQVSGKAPREDCSLNCPSSGIVILKARTSQLVLNAQFCYRFQKDRLPVLEIAPGSLVAGLEREDAPRVSAAAVFVVFTVQVREKRGELSAAACDQP